MSVLEQLGLGQGFAKVGILGFNKSGKTYTATEIAIGLFKMLGGDIAFFDTETGSEYVAGKIRKATGKPLMGKKSRSLKDLMAVAKEMKRGDILLVDSITHPWRELCESHLRAVNESLARKNRAPRTKLEFQDWGPIKAEWEKWTTWFLNSPVHVIICGRAGFEYDMELNEETNRKELIKTGTKMKTESEFGFEPSLLIEMERVLETSGKSRRVTKRQAIVIGDRFDVLDGKVFLNPKFKDFEPHFKLLTPGAHSEIDTDLKSDTGVGDDGDGEWNRERKLRSIFAEEIQGLLTAHYPGQTAADKKEKADLLWDTFHTRSWTAVENTDSKRLKDGLSRLRFKLEPQNHQPATDLPTILYQRGGYPVFKTKPNAESVGDGFLFWIEEEDGMHSAYAVKEGGFLLMPDGLPKRDPVAQAAA